MVVRQFTFKCLFWTMLVLSLIHCRPSGITKVNTGKLNVVATTGMIADLVSNIGKDSIYVKALMGPGVDPHLYKATQGDLTRLRTADIIFYNGLHLEGKMGEVFGKLERIKKVYAVSKNIPVERLLQFGGEDAHDPHIWFDISLWMEAIPVVESALAEARPDLKDYFATNAKLYADQLLRLHEEVKETIHSIPENQRVLITAHDAFNYFGRAYDIEVRGLQGISTLSEFGLKDRVDLVNFIVDRNIKAVFVETSVSVKNINAIVEGCKSKGHDVVIGGSLFSDAMGAADTPEGNYIGMVNSNVATIVNALK